MAFLLFGIGAYGKPGVSVGGTAEAPSSLAPESRSADGDPRWIGVLDRVGPFEVWDMNGRRWTERDFLGKIVVVRLWSSHCAPCVVDFPEVQKFYKSLKGNPAVLFVSLNLDLETADFSEFMHEFKKEYSFPVLLGRRYFKIGPVPYTWILDQEGYLRDVYIGAPPDWREDTLRRVEAVRQKPRVASLPAEVLSEQRRLNEKDAAKAVQLKK